MDSYLVTFRNEFLVTLSLIVLKVVTRKARGKKMSKKHNKRNAFLDRNDLTRSDIHWIIIAVATFVAIFTLSLAAVYSGIYNPLAV